MNGPEIERLPADHPAPDGVGYLAAPEAPLWLESTKPGHDTLKLDDARKFALPGDAAAYIDSLESEYRRSFRVYDLRTGRMVDSSGEPTPYVPPKPKGQS